MISGRTLPKPPKDIADLLSKQADRVIQFNQSRRLRLTEDKKDQIVKDLCNRYEQWDKKTTTMRRRIIEYNDMYEGVVEETNFPFEGASNITTHYAATNARTFRSVANKTMYQDPNIFIARRFDNSIDTDIVKLERGMNFTFNSETNGLDTLKSGTIPCYRDGTMLICGTWERNVEKGQDSKSYKSAAEFIADYPDPESAGIAVEEYQGILDEFITTPDLEIVVYYDYDFVAHDGPVYDLISLAEFVFYPHFAKTIKQMELYGKTYQLSLDTVRSRAKRKQYYADVIEKLESRKSGPREFNRDNWILSRDFIEGLSAGGGKDDKNKPVDMVDFVWRTDMDGDGIPEKYIGTFSPTEKLLFTIEKTPLRKNIDNVVDFRFVERDGRFLGTSLMGCSFDLYNLLDAIHRHRNNIRMLVASPVFAVQKSYKEEIDFGRAENTIRPGLTLYVDDVRVAIKQVEIRNLDQPGNSMDEETLIVRYIEMATGVTQGQSGKESQRDPRAPMGKTLALLNQANLRIDDYIDEFIKSIPRLAELHAALYYQYASGSDFQYTITAAGKVEQVKINKSWLIDERIKWTFPKRSVTFSPEFAMRRLASVSAYYTQLLPLMAQGDTRAIEMYNRFVISSGEPDYEKLIFPIPQAVPQLAAPATGPSGAGEEKGIVPPMPAAGQSKQLPVKQGNELKERLAQGA